MCQEIFPRYWNIQNVCHESFKWWSLLMFCHMDINLLGCYGWYSSVVIPWGIRVEDPPTTQLVLKLWISSFHLKISKNRYDSMYILSVNALWNTEKFGKDEESSIDTTYKWVYLAYIYLIYLHITYKLYICLAWSQKVPILIISYEKIVISLTRSLIIWLPVDRFSYKNSQVKIIHAYIERRNKNYKNGNTYSAFDQYPSVFLLWCSTM